MAEAGGPAWDAEGFQRLQDHVRSRLHQVTEEVVTRVERILATWHAAQLALASRATAPGSGDRDDVVADIREQLDALIHPGFVTATGHDRLPHLHRYLRAVERRLERLPGDPRRDREWMYKVHDIEDEYRDLLDRLPPARRDAREVRDIRWMIEELRVSFFAQQLGTPTPVSEKRIRKAMEQVEGGR
jgi:ATP-dependent helicase HrpA